MDIILLVASGPLQMFPRDTPFLGANPFSGSGAGDADLKNLGKGSTAWQEHSQGSTAELSCESESGFWRLPWDGTPVAREGASGCPSSDQQLPEACDLMTGQEDAPSGRSGLMVVWIKLEVGLGPPSPSFGLEASGLLESAYHDLAVEPVFPARGMERSTLSVGGCRSLNTAPILPPLRNRCHRPQSPLALFPWLHMPGLLLT